MKNGRRNTRDLAVGKEENLAQIQPHDPNVNMALVIDAIRTLESES
jgi:hypothetical protein